MSIRTITVCDRCGSERSGDTIATPSERRELRRIVGNQAYAIDLCADCDEKFVRWMSNVVGNVAD